MAVSQRVHLKVDVWNLFGWGLTVTSYKLLTQWALFLLNLIFQPKTLTVISQVPYKGGLLLFMLIFDSTCKVLSAVSQM